MPAFGRPINPTSARSFNSKNKILSSPGSPGWANRGACLVEDLKWALPSPPFPPFAAINSCPSIVRSNKTSLVSASFMIVPGGTGITRFFPFLPCISLPIPCCPFSALYCCWYLISRRVLISLLVLKIICPPLPPSPPSGPPFGIYFSLRKLIQPLPPSPALT